ncbi:cupin domain-containing protein [Sulfurimonas aquatica]|uniref:Cupin domain-containing protein n=1 Tax=Sulfurimonas aquatica TaxID=2672570 RepID=A0A975B072_9BACT|nr:pirin family protein [Sulfurimonas aquatica]QSZ41822.1 cupin domain-containing protein [Sulfurimonas aquatica]
MLKKLPKENMGSSNLGWLESRFHFSFADYRNYDNMNFGVLRVLNDDIIHPSSGFNMHPHHDMEIISYIVDGEITHQDSMGNSETLKRGEVQYMSAGSGIVHAEHNESSSEDLRLLQIWIVPPEKNLEVLYGSHMYTKKQRENKLLNIVSSIDGDAAVKIYQDINMFVSELQKGKNLEFSIGAKRQVYFVQIQGCSTVNGVILDDGDAMEITQESSLGIKALQNSHFLFIEMPEG